MSKNYNRVRRNIVMYLANLVQHNGAIAIFKKSSELDRFNSSWHTRRIARKAIDVLVNEGYITFTKGHNGYAFKTGFSSILTLTPKGITLINSCSKVQPSILHSTHQSYTHNDYIISTRGTNDLFEEEVITKEIPDVEMNNVTDDLARELLERRAQRNSERLNDYYFSRMTLTHKTIKVPEFLKNVKLTRIFQDKGCGRFYQKYGTSFQNISREERKGLLINGEETVEVDFSAMHLNLLYAKLGVENKHMRDSYAPILADLNLGKEFRGIIKRCVFVAINAKDYKGFVTSFNAGETGREVVAKLKEKNIKVNDVLESFKRIHEPIAKYLHSNSSIELMLDESNIMEEILLALMVKNILALPLHDAVICQRKNVTEVKEIMLNEYCKYTGTLIRIETKGDYEEMVKYGSGNV